tara:strand:+ start:30389 stop:30580 length:192 start_codon:yes stop_codon:yes gene_type:complete
MAKFTLHNEHGDFMHDTAKSLNSAKDKCDNVTYNCKVCETYFAPSPFDSTKITEHGREVYRNY